MLTEKDCATKLDLGQVVCPKVGQAETCSLFSGWGTRITSCGDVKDEDPVYLVPEGRLFMWPTHDIGHKAHLRHIGMPAGEPIILETISQRPRVFRLHNFFSEAEADILVEHALGITEEVSTSDILRSRPSHRHPHILFMAFHLLLTT